MYYRALLAAAAVLTCTGDSSVHAPPETVQAFAGGDVILPCSFPVTASGDFPTVEWSKEGLQPNVVFLFRDGCETYEMKNPAFEYRTSLIPRELKNRNISLRISDVQLSDAGTYRCMRVWRNAPRDITTVKLVVGAVSEPKLSFVSPESGGVTLQCEAGCWLREPEVTFLDHQGNKIPADEPKRAQGAGGCYTVTRRLALQEDTKRVTCRVYQPEINQTRTAEILLSVDCMRSCALTVCMAVGGTVVLLLATCASAVFLRKRCGKSVDEYKLPVSRKSSDQGTVSGTYENQSFLQCVRVDEDADMKNATIEKLSQEVADLKSKLQEAVLQRETVSNAQPNSVFGQQMQNTNPEPVLRIPRARINNSPDDVSVALSSSSSSAGRLKKRLSYESGLTSLSSAQPGPSVPNLKRRHSSVLPYSISNRFKHPPDLPEESHTLL